jgi:hypothetical protein
MKGISTVFGSPKIVDLTPLSIVSANPFVIYSKN